MVKKTIIVIISIMMAIIVMYNIYYLFNIRVLKNEYSSISDYALIEIQEDDMKSTLKKGDLVFISKIEDNYKIGDIVAFYDGNKYVAHRILTISNNEALIKPDDGSRVDTVKLDKIIGKYSFRVGFVGNIFLLLKNTSISISLLVIGTVICIFLNLNSFEEKEKIKELEETREFERKMLKK